MLLELDFGNAAEGWEQLPELVAGVLAVEAEVNEIEHLAVFGQLETFDQGRSLDIKVNPNVEFYLLFENVAEVQDGGHQELVLVVEGLDAQVQFG